MVLSSRSTNEVMPLILGAVREAKMPVTFAALLKRTRVSADDLKLLLSTAIADGELHRWPDLRKQQRFWHRSEEEAVRGAIFEASHAIALPANLLAKQARKLLPGYPAKLLTSAIQQMIREKALRKYPPFGRGTPLLAPAAHPASYAAAGEAAIEKIRRQLSEQGIVPVAPPPAPGVDLSESTGAILRALRHLDPSQTSAVSVRELREALPQLSKEDFDSAALRLYSDRKVFLSQHDFPQSLSPADRQLLIDGPKKDGTYFVAISARL